MKAYRIRVPESEIIGNGVIFSPNKNTKPILTRPEIHKMIEKKAIQLGWKNIEFKWPGDSITLYLDSEGDVWFDLNLDKISEKSIEISWQDFLNLTPEDVKTNSSEIPNGSKIERNEKAWELYKNIFTNNYESYCNGKFTVKGLKIDCLSAVDEFLKQAESK